MIVMVLMVVDTVVMIRVVKVVVMVRVMVFVVYGDGSDAKW